MQRRIPVHCPYLFAIFFIVVSLQRGTAQTNKEIPPDVGKYDVVWDAPVENALGSMPLGNGSTGLNVWVEKNGDLLFYISSPDAEDEQHKNIKEGLIRIRLTPCPFVEGSYFRQRLDLKNGQILIDAGQKEKAVHLKIWVDANRPTIKVQGMASTDLSLDVRYELWRDLKLVNDLADTTAKRGDILFSGTSDKQDIVWYHRNVKTIWEEKLRNEGGGDLLDAGKVKDPLKDLTYGGFISGRNLLKKSPSLLQTSSPTKQIDISIILHSGNYPSPGRWYAAMTAIKQEVTKTNDQAYRKHNEWWHLFWQRSWIDLSGFENAFIISQRYTLQRFVNACSNRGKFPSPFNGGIFSVDMPAGSWTFFGPLQKSENADYRAWDELPIMWQNTRHIYWPMMASGDYDLMQPVIDACYNSLDIAKERVKNWFGHKGAILTEAMYWNGVSAFGRALPEHLSTHFLASIEIPSMLADYYNYTLDRQFLVHKLLPLADEYILFYQQHYQRKNSLGKIVFGPMHSVETYSDVINPITEVSGLRYLLSHLLLIDKNLIGPQRFQRWSNLLNSIPSLPLRKVNGQALLAVGNQYSGREIVESPEMYAVFPFRQATVCRDSLLSVARQTFYLRTTSLDGVTDKQWAETGGWNASPVVAAYLGLPLEAGDLITKNFKDDTVYSFLKDDGHAVSAANPGFKKFPAFWSSHFDWTPDQCHGGNSLNALQSMILQNEGEKIYLLPAFPETWNVSFKLHASHNTIIKGIYKNGRFQQLTVSPAFRKADIVDMSTLQRRIKNRVTISGNDYNYLYNLPPMRDGNINREDIGKGGTTGKWMEKYSESYADVHAGPYKAESWGASVFRDSVIYLHILDSTATDLHLLSIPNGVTSVSVLTGGEAHFQQRPTETVIFLNTARNTPERIVKMVTDNSIMPFMLKSVFKNSLSTGSKVLASSFKDGMSLPAFASDENAQTGWCKSDTDVMPELHLILPRKSSITRAQILLNNPHHIRGQGISFELQYKTETENWKTILKSAIYGNIWSEKFDAVTTQELRLLIDKGTVQQLDVFSE